MIFETRPTPDNWVQSASGVDFPLFPPQAQNVRLWDIAHALSMQARYNGHTTKFYSVAQHSVLMSHAIKPLWDQEVRSEVEHAVYCVELKLHALLHDAAEAYLGDVVQPVKATMPEFSEWEDRVLDVIYQALGLSLPDKRDAARVKHYDLRMLLTEKQQIVPKGGRTWFIESMPEIEPLDTDLLSWRSCTGLIYQPLWRRRYLNRYRELKRAWLALKVIEEM